MSRHQPAHAFGAPAPARAGADRRAAQLRRGAAARRVRADCEGRVAAADHRCDARVRPRVARARARPRTRLTDVADRRRLAGPLLVELGAQIRIATAALRAVPRTPLILPLEQERPAVVRPRIPLAPAEHTTEPV